MKPIPTYRTLSGLLWVAAVWGWAFLAAPLLPSAQQSAAKTVPVGEGAKAFDTPQQAADALVDAAAKFDVDTLVEIFGPDGDDLVLTGEIPQDRQRAIDFSAEARERKPFPWIQRRRIVHFSSWAMRTGRSPSRL
jgi:hypothetical protein